MKNNTHRVGGTKVECNRDGLVVERSRAYTIWLASRTFLDIYIHESDSLESQNACIASSPLTLASGSYFPNGMNLDRAVIVI